MRPSPAGIPALPAARRAKREGGEDVNRREYLQREEPLMDILVLSLVAGMVVLGGIWLATRDTKPPDRPSR